MRKLPDTDIRIRHLRGLPASHERHPDAVAVGVVRTGDAEITFLLTLAGDIQLPPGVHLSDEALIDLRVLAQATEMLRLRQPDTQAGWHAADAA